MEHLKTTPPPKAEALHQFEFSGSEVTLLVLGLRYVTRQNLAAEFGPDGSLAKRALPPPSEFIALDDVYDAARALWQQLYRFGDPSLAMQDELAAKYPK